MTNILRITKNFLLLSSSLLFLFIISIYAATLIPKSMIHQHVVSSCSVISENMNRGFPIYIPGASDSFTDGIMINIASVQDSSQAMTTSMQGIMLLIDDNWSTAADACILYFNGETDEVKPSYYGRYWHGYILPLKVLLMFFDYYEIITIGAVIFFSAFIWLIILTYKKLGGKVAFCFAFSQFLFLTPASVLSLTNPVCYIIAYAASIAILFLPNKCILSFHFTSLFFFTIGGLTCFFDFLRTPVLCLGIPLTYFLLVRHKQKYLNKVADLVPILAMVVTWLFGYVSLWSVKWGILYFVGTSGDAMSPADAIIYRTFSEVFSAKYMYRSIFIIASTVAYFVCMFFYLCYVKNKHSHVFVICLGLLLIASLAPGWAVLAMNHTVIHAAFVHRIYSLVAFCLLLVLSLPRPLSSTNE